MSDPIKDLERLTEARKKATAGPWHKDTTYTGSVFPDPVVSSSWVMGDGRDVDATFVALAGSLDLPAILAHVKAMEKVCEVMHGFRRDDFLWRMFTKHFPATATSIEPAISLYTKGQADAK